MIDASDQGNLAAHIVANDVPEILPASIRPNYKAFLAGAVSGATKLCVGHPFDTIKVRLQTSSKGRFSGPVQCVLETFRREGVRGFYKGAAPPLLGWMIMDATMLGSLNFYRRVLNDRFFANPDPDSMPSRFDEPRFAHVQDLPAYGHGIAGLMAGFTVSVVAAPIEHIKARLQVQYSHKSQSEYRGPVDCLRKIYRSHGIGGIYRGIWATMIFRSSFFFLWGSYDILQQFFKQRTNLSKASIDFWSGGLSAQIFWISSYPADVIKQRIMTDGWGAEQKLPNWRIAARTIHMESGWRGYWRGFTPCFLRALPTNACALAAFGITMRALESP